VDNATAPRRQTESRAELFSAIDADLAIVEDAQMASMPKSKSERALLVFGILLLLVGLSYGLADWRGNSAWEKYKREWEAKGEKFDFKDFVPKPVADDQNFALTPIIASSYEYILDKNGHRIIPQNTNVIDRLSLKIFDEYSSDNPTNGYWAIGRKTDLKAFQLYYRTLAAKTNEFPIASQPQSPAADVLLALSKYDSTIEELRVASRLPDSRFPLNYEADPPAIILLPHLAGLKYCSQVLQLRAVAELQNNQSDKALADVKLSLRLIDSIRIEPFLISHLVRIAMVQITLQPIWEGLTEHKWSDAQLAELNQELAKLDFLTDYEFSMRGERANSIAGVDHLRRKRDFQEMINIDSMDSDTSGIDRETPFSQQLAGIAYHLIPSSVFYQNELAIAQMHQQWTLQFVNIEQRLVLPEITTNFSNAIDKMRQHWSPNNILALIMLPAVGTTVRKYACAQSSVDMARVACALERYRLAHGEYPETLDVLVPQFIEKIPRDIIGGQPLHYRRTDDGKFLLYSVGWNETDDGGVIVFRKDSKTSIDNVQGDWVWKN